MGTLSELSANNSCQDCSDLPPELLGADEAWCYWLPDSSYILGR